MIQEEIFRHYAIARSRRLNPSLRILVHPETFRELKREWTPEIFSRVYERPGFKGSLFGMPLIVTDDVDGWEVVERVEP